MSHIYSVAIVGAGIGERHLEAFLRLTNHFKVALIVDLDQARAAKLADSYAAAGHTRPALAKDYRDAAVTGIDVVDICVPPSLHYAATEHALNAGKHVICEKPLTASLKELDALNARAAAQKLLLMPVFQYRFGHGLDKAKHLMQSGSAGKVYLSTIETHWTRGADYYAVAWRGKKATELGGVFAGHAIHAHDMLTHLVGDVRAVSAMTTVRVNAIETEDTAGALFEMADGSLAVSSATLGSADEISRIRICCENVTMVSSLSPYTPNRDPWTFIPKAPKDQAYIEKALAGAPKGLEGYTEQFAGFHKSLNAGAPLPITAADGRRSIELLSALYYAAKIGQKVALPLTTTHPVYNGWLTA
jgi:predicted dehydrogenase